MNPALLSGLSRLVANAIGEDKKGSKFRDSDIQTSALAEVNANSILELGQAANVEVITAIDSSLTIHESTTDVLKFLNSLYSSWYLSAAGVVTDTGRIKTVNLLQKLNPQKSPGYAIANSILSGAEAGVGARVDMLEFAVEVDLENPEEAGEFSENEISASPTSEPLPPLASLPTSIDQIKEAFESARVTSLESKSAAAQATKKTPAEIKQEEIADDLKHRNNFSGYKSGADLVNVQNLSVGQSIVLSVSDGTAKKDVFVNIRLLTVPVSNFVLKTILGWSQKDLRVKSRLSAWRAGELAFWRDVVFMRDIFTERKRIMMNDKSGLLQAMLGRQRDSMINSVLTAQPNVGNMSSILVISEDNLQRLEETELDGRISNYSFRQRVMNNTGLIVIAVVNPLTELVTIYTHTQSLPTEASIRQLKAASKAGAADLGEMIKLMNQSKMPSF